MTDIEKFNLLWLCHAMTAPTKSDEAYYYDGQSKRFFYSKQNNLGHAQLYNMVDLSLTKEVRNDLSLRLRNMDSASCEIVEIPRLNVQDKVNVQLLFLSKFPGIIHEEQLRLDVEQQADVSKFVLDVVLNMNKILEPMLPYWEDFKLKTIQYYLEKYTGVLGITLRMIQ